MWKASDVRQDADLEAVQVSVALKHILTSVEEYRRQFGLVFLALFGFAALHVGLVVIANLCTLDTRVQHNMLTARMSNSTTDGFADPIATAEAERSYDIAYIMANVHGAEKRELLSNLKSVNFVDAAGSYRAYTVTGFQLQGHKDSELKLYTAVGHVLKYVRGTGLQVISRDATCNCTIADKAPSTRKLLGSAALVADVQQQTLPDNSAFLHYLYDEGNYVSPSTLCADERMVTLNLYMNDNAYDAAADQYDLTLLTTTQMSELQDMVESMYACFWKGTTDATNEAQRLEALNGLDQYFAYLETSSEYTAAITDMTGQDAGKQCMTGVELLHELSFQAYTLGPDGTTVSEEPLSVNVADLTTTGATLQGLSTLAHLLRIDCALYNDAAHAVHFQNKATIDSVEAVTVGYEGQGQWNFDEFEALQADDNCALEFQVINAEYLTLLAKTTRTDAGNPNAENGVLLREYIDANFASETDFIRRVNEILSTYTDMMTSSEYQGLSGSDVSATYYSQCIPNGETAPDASRCCEHPGWVDHFKKVVNYDGSCEQTNAACSYCVAGGDDGADGLVCYPEGCTEMPGSVPATDCEQDPFEGLTCAKLYPDWCMESPTTSRCAERCKFSRGCSYVDSISASVQNSLNDDVGEFSDNPSMDVDPTGPAEAAFVLALHANAADAQQTYSNYNSFIHNEDATAYAEYDADYLLWYQTAHQVYDAETSGWEAAVPELTTLFGGGTSNFFGGSSTTAECEAQCDAMCSQHLSQVIGFPISCGVGYDLREQCMSQVNGACVEHFEQFLQTHDGNEGVSLMQVILQAFGLTRIDASSVTFENEVLVNPQTGGLTDPQEIGMDAIRELVNAVRLSMIQLVDNTYSGLRECMEESQKKQTLSLVPLLKGIYNTMQGTDFAETLLDDAVTDYSLVQEQSDTQLSNCAELGSSVWMCDKIQEVWNHQQSPGAGVRPNWMSAEMEDRVNDFWSTMSPGTNVADLITDNEYIYAVCLKEWARFTGIEYCNNLVLAREERAMAYRQECDVPGSMCDAWDDADNQNPLATEFAFRFNTAPMGACSVNYVYPTSGNYNPFSLVDRRHVEMGDNDPGPTGGLSTVNPQDNTVIIRNEVSMSSETRIGLWYSGAAATRKTTPLSLMIDYKCNNWALAMDSYDQQQMQWEDYLRTVDELEAVAGVAETATQSIIEDVDGQVIDIINEQINALLTGIFEWRNVDVWDAFVEFKNTNNWDKAKSATDEDLLTASQLSGQFISGGVDFHNDLYGCSTDLKFELIDATAKLNVLAYDACDYNDLVLRQHRVPFFSGTFFSFILGAYDNFAIYLPPTYCNAYNAQHALYDGFILEPDFGSAYMMDYLIMLHGYGGSSGFLHSAAHVMNFAWRGHARDGSGVPSFNACQGHNDVVNRYVNAGDADHLCHSLAFPGGFAVLAPDGSGCPLGGRMWWTNSEFTGFLMDYVVFELPQYMIHHLGMNPRSIGIFGFSMGGFGSLNIMISYPENVASVYAANAPIYPNDCFFAYMCHDVCALDVVYCELLFTSFGQVLNSYVILWRESFVVSRGSTDPVAVGVAWHMNRMLDYNSEAFVECIYFEYSLTEADDAPQQPTMPSQPMPPQSVKGQKEEIMLKHGVGGKGKHGHGVAQLHQDWTVEQQEYEQMFLNRHVGDYRTLPADFSLPRDNYGNPVSCTVQDWYDEGDPFTCNLYDSVDGDTRLNTNIGVLDEYFKPALDVVPSTIDAYAEVATAYATAVTSVHAALPQIDTQTTNFGCSEACDFNFLHYDYTDVEANMAFAYDMIFVNWELMHQHGFTASTMDVDLGGEDDACFAFACPTLRWCLEENQSTGPDLYLDAVSSLVASMKFVPFSNPVYDSMVPSAFSHFFWSMPIVKFQLEMTNLGASGGNEFAEYGILLYLHCSQNDEMHIYPAHIQYAALLMGAEAMDHQLTLNQHETIRDTHYSVASDGGLDMSGDEDDEAGSGGYINHNTRFVIDFNDCDGHEFTEHDMQNAILWFSDSLHTMVGSNGHSSIHSFNIHYVALFENMLEWVGETGHNQNWNFEGLRDYNGASLCWLRKVKPDHISDNGAFVSSPNQQTMTYDAYGMRPKGLRGGAGEAGQGQWCTGMGAECPYFLHQEHCYSGIHLWPPLFDSIDIEAIAMSNMFTAEEWMAVEQSNEQEFDPNTFQVMNQDVATTMGDCIGASGLQSEMQESGVLLLIQANILPVHTSALPVCDPTYGLCNADLCNLFTSEAWLQPDFSCDASCVENRMCDPDSEYYSLELCECFFEMSKYHVHSTGVFAEGAHAVCDTPPCYLGRQRDGPEHTSKGAAFRDQATGTFTCPPEAFELLPGSY
mmetsp:Transcript_31959/g.38634  ORF Transcript_31959/g.38634 Transcript_31959/m.38634 type:complete len:2338 (-) Transcript_31959:755-7768(-)|eukprot:CAMPEP_0197849598 /NCGR_PEP_ID=MMETSP1438-20131217/12683_1 /TAXON_ID=1461541 /ORGANISM="Pterosperma sp., Strain CCMP1384" /LENGTH=2337 /DNA_ID=CAMNT_0043462371 /DNA_START=84 /DNA_END=7097 /DNA_ORIENTATION=-